MEKRGTRSLAARVAALEQRLAEVERRLGPAGAATGSAVPEPPEHRPILDPERFWALAQLQRRGGPEFDDGQVSGSVMFAGVTSTPGAGEVVWQLELPLPRLMADDWEAASGVLAALSNPTRAQIVRRLLLGEGTVQELQAMPGLGTSGQLYHHLRDLQAAGLVVQLRRGSYAVPADKVVPCLVILGAAASTATVAPGQGS